MMPVLVTGSREFSAFLVVAEALRCVYSVVGPAFIVVHGAARGADSIADGIAREWGIERRAYPVSREMWNALGKRAGHVRNQAMLDAESPSLVLAFKQSTAENRGTSDMICRALSRGVPTIVRDESGAILFMGEGSTPYG